MAILFDARLSGRDFGSHLLYVPDLLEFVKSKRLHLRTTPPIDGHEFVQVEYLLCAIQRNAGEVTIEEAHLIVNNDPILKNERAADDPSSARWLLGAEAHRKWNELLSCAIRDNELSLLHFGSKLPIEPMPAQSGLMVAPAVAGGVSGGVMTEKAVVESAEPIPRVASANTQPPPDGAETVPCTASTWILRKPVRNDGFAFSLYLTLKAALDAGLPLPNPLEVLETLRNIKRPNVHEVLSDEVTFFGGNGTLKTSDLEDIRKRINRMTAP